ncbi:MAG: DUF4177 domain-containing protein [Planctomycetota bacterium]
MNRNYLWLIVAVFIVGLALTTMLATAQETEPTIQWEYNVVGVPRSVGNTSNIEETEAKLNELGKAGWELVDWEERTIILKRPVN